MASERPSALLARLGRASPLVRAALVVAGITSAVTTAAIVAQAIAIASVLGHLFRSSHADVAPGLAALGVATVVRVVSLVVGDVAAARSAAPVRRDLRARLVTRAVRHGYTGPADSLTQLATRGVDAVELYLSRYVPALVTSVVAPAVALTWLVVTDPLSGVIVGLSVGLLPIFMVLLGLEAKGRMEQRWREQQYLAGYVGDVVRGMAVLKAHGRSGDAVARVDEVGQSLRRSTMATLRVAFLSGFALELLSSLATALVALVLGLRLMNGTLALSTALAVLLVTPEVFVPLRRAAANFHGSANGVAAAGELLDALEVPVPPEGTIPAPDVVPTLSVVVPAQGGEPAQRVTIPPGARVAVVGPSGAGKTTLLRSLCALGPSPADHVLVDGLDLGRIDRDEWQRRVAWLAQDPHLSGATVRDAVRAGATDVADRAIVAAMAELDLSLDLDRPLGEGAGELSAGERRRLALVRCLLREPLVLVLDEPTAHLDPATRRLVDAALARRTMTRVVASHREIDADVTIRLALPERDPSSRQSAVARV